MELATLRDLYIDELKDIYSSESQIIKALPKMAKAATSSALQGGFIKHLEETKVHVQRLDQIFSKLKVSPTGKKCKATEGLLKEGAELMEEDANPEVMDAGLICAAQKVEHYEIASYGCVRTYAKLLGEDEAVALLQTTLDEEAATDKKLTGLAGEINIEANSDHDASDPDDNDSTQAVSGKPKVKARTNAANDHKGASMAMANPTKKR